MDILNYYDWLKCECYITVDELKQRSDDEVRYYREMYDEYVRDCNYWSNWAASYGVPKDCEGNYMN